MPNRINPSERTTTYARLSEREKERLNAKFDHPTPQHEREMEDWGKCFSEVLRYIGEDSDEFSVSAGPWTISFDRTGDDSPHSDRELLLISNIKSIVSKIDLSKVSSLPWKCSLENYPFADTGDVTGYCNVVSEDGEVVACAAEEAYQDKPVEKEDGDYDADMLAISECVNAVNAIKELLKGGN